MKSLRGDNRWRAASGAASKDRFPQLRLRPSSSCVVWHHLPTNHLSLKKGLEELEDVWRVDSVLERYVIMFKKITFPTPYIEMLLSIVEDLRRSTLCTTPTQNFYVHCKVYHRIARTDQDWPDVSSGLV